MEITTSQMQGRVAVTILHIRGEVDSSNFQQFSSVLRDVVEGGAEGLLLDLSQVAYMSSAGIRSLNEVSLLLRKKYPQDPQNARSSRLKLFNPQDRVFDVIKISGVDSIFATFTNLEEAVASF